MAVPLEMLTHPELLSNQQLLAVIHERHLRIPNVESMPRDDLLELFHNFCVPYGQRKYRDRGRGKILNKTRQMSPERPFNLNSMNHPVFSNQNKTMLHSDGYERLKPPPDALAGHMKRIKITTLALPIDNNLKRKITDTLSTDSPPQKKERKPITWP
ncbi:ashwin-like [Epargyreus clarus]|uniref:ashwin-like n=1 Tax=Epargyreus clarus TaxID=520877 RepID=UPI003C2BE870